MSIPSFLLGQESYAWELTSTDDRLAFQDAATRSLRTVPTDGSQIETIISTQATTHLLSGNGNRIAFTVPDTTSAQSRATLWHAPVDGGSPAVLVSNWMNVVDETDPGVLLSSDGVTLVYRSHANAFRASFASTDTGVPLGLELPNLGALQLTPDGSRVMVRTGSGWSSVQLSGQGLITYVTPQGFSLQDLHASTDSQRIFFRMIGVLSGSRELRSVSVTDGSETIHTPPLPSSGVLTSGWVGASEVLASWTNGQGSHSLYRGNVSTPGVMLEIPEDLVSPAGVTEVVDFVISPSGDHVAYLLGLTPRLLATETPSESLQVVGGQPVLLGFDPAETSFCRPT